MTAELTVAEAEWLDGWTAGPTEDQGSGLPSGAKAPDLALADHTGQERLLSEFWAGQPALLMFWRHFGCGCGVARAGRLKAEYQDARVRANRLADPYVWLDVYILDAQCNLGRRHGHPGTKLWADTMRQLASRTGMRELTVRSMIHGAALGNEGDAAAAVLLAADIENPVLDLILPARGAR